MAWQWYGEVVAGFTTKSGLTLKHGEGAPQNKVTLQNTETGFNWSIFGRNPTSILRPLIFRHTHETGGFGRSLVGMAPVAGISLKPAKAQAFCVVFVNNIHFQTTLPICKLQCRVSCLKQPATLAVSLCCCAVLLDGRYTPNIFSGASW